MTMKITHLLLVFLSILIFGFGCSSQRKLKSNTQASSYKITGELIPVSMLFDESLSAGNAFNAFREGTPGGIRRGNSFTLLLIDGRVLSEAFVEANGAVKVRAKGILHDNGKSMTPFRIEYQVTGVWRVLDLPHSGISGPGVMGGDEE